MDTEEILTDQQKLDKANLEFEAEFEKRMGAKPSEFIKKSDQIQVLTPEEKLEIEEKERQEAFKYGLDNKVFTTKEHEEYITASQEKATDLLRKKYIKDHPDDKDAGKNFDLIWRLNEDDELIDGEITTPNLAKQKAAALLEKQRQDYIDTNFSKIKGVTTQYGNFKEEQKVVKENTELVAKAIAEVPKKIVIDNGYGSADFTFSDTDFAAANKMVAESGILTKKGIKPEEVKEVVNRFLMGSRVEDIIKEATRVAVENAVNELERGKSGIEVKRGEAPDGTLTLKEGFLKEMGIKIGP